jgi:chaperonin cofactor prefoldin
MPENEFNKKNNSKWEEWSNEVLTQLINLNNKCENLSKDNNNLEQKIVRLENLVSKEIDDTNTLLGNTNELVSGNGDPAKGLVLRVAVLEKDKTDTDKKLDELKDSLKEEKEDKKKIFIAVLALLITSIISLCVFLFKFFVLKQAN